MPRDTNRSLRDKLSSGRLVLALRTGLDIGREALESALAKADYDLLYTDLQHSPYGEQQLQDYCTMAESLGYPVEIRIPHTRSAHLAGRLCDFGPAGILVPEVAHPDDVREALRHFYYPPLGQRSFGGGHRHHQKREETSPRAYADYWNRTGVLGIQIESVAAVVSARQLAMPGVGYVSFGPADLGFSLEMHPAFPFRTPEACMRHVAEQLRGTGIALGIAVVLRPEERQRYIDAGLTVFMEGPRP